MEVHNLKYHRRQIKLDNLLSFKKNFEMKKKSYFVIDYIKIGGE